MLAMSAPISISEGRAKFLAAVKGPMTTDLARRKELLQKARDFERSQKVAALFAWLRLIGIVQRGASSPTPDEDEALIERVRVAFGKYKVLSGDQIKLRKAREVPLQDREDREREDGPGHGTSSPLDRHVHAEWLRNTFD